MKKCPVKDCERQIEDQYKYCSIECAIYDKAFSVKKTEIENYEEID